MTYSATFPISCSNSGETASADFLVPTGATRLSGTVGINDKSDNSGSSASFTVLNSNGSPLAPTVSVGYGHDGPVDVPLNGAVRVRLQVKFAMTHSGFVR